jgi:hypothetical protein
MAQLGLWYSRASPQWYTMGRAAPREMVAGEPARRPRDARETRNDDGK